jgi:medium-chain acyl-[acyl-carrier-protein] hydrolase
MEAPFTHLSPLIQALAQALVPLLDKPFAFFGHSLGALVSFELARHLRKQSGVLPVCLFVSADRAPQFPSRHRPIHALPKPEFIIELLHVNGTPHEAAENSELMQIMIPVLRADFGVYETYQHATEAPLDCKIYCFGGLWDPRVSRGELEGWRDQTSVALSLHMFPGDHFFLKATEPLLLQALSQDLMYSWPAPEIAERGDNGANGGTK